MPNRGLIVMAALVATMLIVAGGATALGDDQIPMPDGQTVATATTTTTTTPEDPVQAEEPPATPAPVLPVLTPAPTLGMGQTLKIFRQQAIRRANKQTLFYRKAAWRWQSLMGRRHTPSSFKASAIRSLAYAKWVRDLWQHRATSLHRTANRWMEVRIQDLRASINRWSKAMGVRPVRTQRMLASGGLLHQFLLVRKAARKVSWQYRHPPHLQQFMCIHGHEGSWTDPNAPYWGGIQFGFGEWRRFGYPYTGKLYANEASPLEQIWAGERYWRLSGFYPWPQTARTCGLI